MVSEQSDSDETLVAIAKMRRVGTSSLEHCVANVQEEFNKLKQKGNVEEYQEKLKDLKSFMMKYHAWLDESYYVSSFISGLSKELRPMVKIFKLSDLHQAYEVVEMERAEFNEEKIVKDGNVEISLHAIKGSGSMNTLKIKGMVNGKDILILIDSGSTHSFDG
ncbi:conserved hypothetical protein [Ricinus communis]|uniref:Uncharacterized protein n=1 Tax=Ricinus communis TaxID=3988 RepID=B9S9K4_RICCO|nr:conserved hypothetical protein [Ricinus communis]